LVIVLELEYDNFIDTQLTRNYVDFLREVIDEYEGDATAAINYIFHIAKLNYVPEDDD
jgi:hypothetical protein